MLSKLKSMIKIALLKSLTDGEVYQVGTFEYMGVEQKAVMYSPYGLYSNPPNDTPAVLMQVGGSESRQVAFISDPTQRPTQEKGDVGLRADDMSVLLHTDGTIEIKGATKEMVAVLHTHLTNVESLTTHLETLGTHLQLLATNLNSATVVTALGASPFTPATIALLAADLTNIIADKGNMTADKALMTTDKNDLFTMKV